MVEPTEVERRLIENAQSGVMLNISAEQARDVRAVVIRDLLRGSYTDDPDPRGVRLRGARIIGELDLADVRTEAPLTLQDCSHDEPINLTRAHLPHLDLSGSTFPALEAADFVCEHDLQLSRVRSQRLHLVGANVSGQLNLTDAQLSASTTPALNAERITIGNGLFLTNSVGSVELDGTRLQCTTGPALNADWLSVTGSIFLNEGFTADSNCKRGTIRLQGASITGQLNLNDATLSNSTNDGPGLVVIGARIASDLVLPTHALDNSGNRSVLISLNGLQYPFVPRRATHREWLTLLAHHTPAYAAQPYQQLATVHRAAGHEREAREILIAQQRDFRKRGELGGGRRLLHLASGAFIGHGHRPFRALGYLAGVCLLAGITSLAAFALGITIRATPPGGPCTPAESFGLAADTALPLLKTGGAKRCEFATTTPVGQIFFATSYILHMLGWAFATLFVAGYTGLVRKTT